MFAPASPPRSPGAALVFATAGHKEHSGSTCPAARQAVPLKILNPGSVLHPQGRHHPPRVLWWDPRARSSGVGGILGAGKGRRVLGWILGDQTPYMTSGRDRDARDTLPRQKGFGVFFWGAAPPQMTAGHTGKGPGCSGCRRKTEGFWGAFSGGAASIHDIRKGLGCSGYPCNAGGFWGVF